MKARPMCAACMLVRRAVELEQVGSSKPSAAISWFRSILETANLYFGPDIEIALLASMTFRRLKSITGVEDPYEAVKRQEMELATRISGKVRDLIAKEEDGAKKLAIALSAASYATLVQRGLNNFYFSPAPALAVLNELEAALTIVGVKEGVVHVNRVVELLKARGSPTIYYLTGTVAELPFDMIVMDVLREEFNSYIVAIVRGKPYEDYVTAREAEEAGLGDHVDEVIETGTDSVTVTMEENASLYASLSSADLVIVKGELQALYYVNNPPGSPLLLLVATKCPVAARVLGVELNKVNIVLVERGKAGGQQG